MIRGCLLCPSCICTPFSLVKWCCDWAATINCVPLVWGTCQSGWCVGVLRLGCSPLFSLSWWLVCCTLCMCWDPWRGSMICGGPVQNQIPSVWWFPNLVYPGAMGYLCIGIGVLFRQCQSRCRVLTPSGILTWVLCTVCMWAVRPWLLLPSTYLQHVSVSVQSIASKLIYLPIKRTSY